MCQELNLVELPYELVGRAIYRSQLGFAVISSSGKIQLALYKNNVRCLVKIQCGMVGKALTKM